MTTFNDFSERSITYMSSLGGRIVLSTATHPFDYAKFLIQIGHEPLPSYPTKNLFGRPVRALPNVFKYVSYIRNVDGLLGCYRGFAPKITGQIISTMAAENITKYIKVNDTFDPREDEVSDRERYLHFQQTLLRDVVGRSVTIAVSQPFYVISSRMMAQFVGGEETYSGIFASLKEIYQHEGILGFFTGIVPRWLGEVTSLVLSSFIVYGVNNYLIQDNELKSFAGATIQFLIHTFTYPFVVVSACITVNNCGLVAGEPPNMPVYDSWTHCWRHLHQTSQLHRGSSMLLRYCPSAKKTNFS